MTPPLIRAALVGFGHIAQKHLSHMQTHPGFECVVVVEPDEARAAQARAQGHKVEPSLEALLGSGCSVDLGVLATPSGLHPAQAHALAQAGVHVLTEKPMALDVTSARGMIAACASEGVGLFVAQQMRDWPLMQALKRAVDARAFGRVSTCAIQLLWTRPQAYFDAAPWRGTPELDGGVLLNQANHYVDALVWLFGRPERVFCTRSAHARDVGTDDTCALTCMWPAMTASLHASLLSYPRNLESSISVLGERGSARFAGPSCQRVDAWTFEGTHEPIEPAQQAQSALVQGGYAPLYQRIWQQWCARPGALTGSDTSALLDVLALTQAAAASATAQRVMTLEPISATFEP